MAPEMVRLRIALFGVLAAALAACPAAPPPDTIRFGMYPTTDQLPVYAMQAEGIAAQHDFVIEESDPSAGGLAALEAMLAGEIDVTYPGIVPALAIAGRGHVPKDVVFVGLNSRVTPDAPAAALVVSEDVVGWADLEGRQIAMHSLTSINAAAFQARAKAEGVVDFEFVIIGLTDMGLAVRDGTVAAAVMEEPWTTQAVLRGDGRILAFVEGEPPLETLPLTVIAVSAQLAADEDLLKRFLRAHLQAVRFIHDQPAQARALFVPELAISNEVAQQLHLKEFLLDARLDVGAVQGLQDLLAGTGGAAPRIDPETFYAGGALEAVLAEGD